MFFRRKTGRVNSSSSIRRNRSHRRRLGVESLETRALLHVADSLMAIQSGAWSDPETWGGHPAAVDADYHIPEGVTVTVDRPIEVPVDDVMVHGTLRFATDRDTQLNVETLHVHQSGHLEVGAEGDSVRSGVTARIIIHDNGPIDLESDPLQESRGIISHGTVTMHGASKTAFLPLGEPAVAGATRLVFRETPENWTVGDRLVIPGVHPTANQDEERTILEIHDTTVVIDPLQYSHVPPHADLDIHVANLTRNISITSENAADISRHGHMMFHNPETSLEYIQIQHLGRTNKLIPLNDPVFDSEGKLVDGSGTNRRARYSIHIHRAGLDTQAEVRGSVISDDPGWGFVNHSSNVLFEGNVSYRAVGAGFASEAGDEIGMMRGNMAIRTVGTGDTILYRRERVQDFGHNGVGFWLQGPGVRLVENVAAGNGHAGFEIWGNGLREADMPVSVTMFNQAYLPDASYARRPERAFDLVNHVRLFQFERNQAYNSPRGAEITFLRSGEAKDFLGWNLTTVGAEGAYSHDFVWNGLKLLGVKYSGIGLNHTHATVGVQMFNVHIAGFRYGVLTSNTGYNLIRGATLENMFDIRLGNGANWPVFKNELIDVQFVVGPMTIKHIELRPIINPNPAYLLGVRTPYFGETTVNGYNLYRDEQRPDYVPFALQESGLPKALIGKTNEQLFQELGMAVGGSLLAPKELSTREKFDGYFGGAPQRQLPIRIVNPTTTRDSEISISYINLDQPTALPKFAGRYQVSVGWNLLTAWIDGRIRGFLVYRRE